MSAFVVTPNAVFLAQRSYEAWVAYLGDQYYDEEQPERIPAWSELPDEYRRAWLASTVQHKRGSMSDTEWREAIDSVR